MSLIPSIPFPPKKELIKTACLFTESISITQWCTLGIKWPAFSGKGRLNSLGQRQQSRVHGSEKTRHILNILLAEVNRVMINAVYLGTCWGPCLSAWRSCHHRAWGYPCLFCFLVVLEIEPRALHTLDECSTTELYCQAPTVLNYTYARWHRHSWDQDGSRCAAGPLEFPFC